MTPRDAQPVLQRLSRLNPTVVFLATAVLVFVALVLPDPVGGVILLALAAGLATLLVRTWPLQRTHTRVLRLIILSGLIALGLSRLLG